MTKDDFIKKYHCDRLCQIGSYDPNNPGKCGECSKKFFDDLQLVVQDSWPKTFAGYNADVNSITICPQCHCFIMFAPDAVTVHSIGGQIIKRTVHCDFCNDEIPLYPWRTLSNG